jgi:hypothetical protein
MASVDGSAGCLRRAGNRSSAQIAADEVLARHKVCCSAQLRTAPCCPLAAPCPVGAHLLQARAPSFARDPVIYRGLSFLAPRCGATLVAASRGALADAETLMEVFFGL